MAIFPRHIRLTAFTALLMAVLSLGPAPRHPAFASTLPTELVIAAWDSAGKHPLVGKIWSAPDGRLVDGLALTRGVLTGTPIADALGIKGPAFGGPAFEGPAFVLLGEVHDNPQHHLLRAGLIDDLTERSAFGRNAHPPVVTEHIRADQAAALDAFRSATALAAQPTTAVDLLQQLQWERSGWPDARMFVPLYDAILAARLPISAGDVARERIRAVARGGLPALDASERRRLDLDAPLPPTLTSALADELNGSHCGMLPGSAIPGMSLAQRYRDAHLAAALVDAGKDAGRTILLAGNGHVRTDRGVPWHLRRHAPGKPIVAVMLIEVEDGKIDAPAYVPRDPDGRPAADVIVFTPRAAREDPCEQMRAHVQKKG